MMRLSSSSQSSLDHLLTTIPAGGVVEVRPWLPWVEAGIGVIDDYRCNRWSLRRPVCPGIPFATPVALPAAGSRQSSRRRPRSWLKSTRTTGAAFPEGIWHFPAGDEQERRHGSARTREAAALGRRKATVRSGAFSS